jgi:hypothetical protein
MINGHDINQFPDKSENLSLGYVKVFRSITKKSWYKKSDYVHLFLHLFLKATHSGFETWFNGSSIVLEPGQLVTGRKKLSEETGINESKIERILSFFKIEQQIEQQKTSTSRLITIINWKFYQQNEQPFEQQVINRRTSNGQPVITIQEGSKGLKGKKGKKSNVFILKNKEEKSSDSIYLYPETHREREGRELREKIDSEWKKQKQLS